MTFYVTKMCLFCRMSFKDFSTNFHRLEICNLTPDSVSDDSDDNVTWQTSYVHGSWKKKVNAGGCRNNKSRSQRYRNKMFTKEDNLKDDIL